MASVVNDPNGRKRILFTDGDSVRRTIRLGKTTTKAAESFCLRVEAILSDRLQNRAHDAELAAWLGKLPESTYQRLVRTGLTEPRQRVEQITVKGLLDKFFAVVSVKASTLKTMHQTRDSLLRLLGTDTPILDIGSRRAEEWRRAMVDEKLAVATVSKRVKQARGIFKKAVRWGLLESNPFEDLKSGPQANPERSAYVSCETIEVVLTACPDAEWRAIVGLCRYAGLRCPSEVSGLRWGDVDWERRALTVRSPKTAGHDGHAVRITPISPKLYPLLQAVFDAAEPGTEAVIPRARDPRVNLRTGLERVLTRASVQPWPRMFHNLRASCETDWVDQHPAHVVAGWLGHSPTIAARHYLHRLDRHLHAATGIGGPESGAKSGAPEAQNAAQQPSASNRTASREHQKVPENKAKTRLPATTCNAVRGAAMTPMGFEPMSPP